MSAAALVRPAPVDGIVDIAGFEQAWNEAVTEPDDAEQSVAVDLRESEYLDQECLLYLVSVLTHRTEEKLPTSLRLPDLPAPVVEFLSDWEFSDAVWAATRHGLNEFLEDADEEMLLRLKAAHRRYVQATPTDSGEGGRENLLPVDFFAIRSLPLLVDRPMDELEGDRLDDAREALAIAAEARDNWLDEHLIEVLDRQLNGYGDRVATDILYEGVLNAAMQRNATLVLTSSQIFTRTRRRLPGEIVVTIWDNGCGSFGDTLRHAWESQHRIVSPAYGLIDESFRFTVSDFATGRESATWVTSSDSIGPASEDDDRLMLWPFMGGTTSRPTAVDKGQESRTEDPSGLGLHIMKSAVIDLFGGSLLYASGRKRLTLRRLDDAPRAGQDQMAGGSGSGRYEATLKCLTHAHPVVAGNLLIARLPCT